MNQTLVLPRNQIKLNHLFIQPALPAESGIGTLFPASLQNNGKREQKSAVEYRIPNSSADQERKKLRCLRRKAYNTSSTVFAHHEYTSLMTLKLAGQLKIKNYLLYSVCSEIFPVSPRSRYLELKIAN